MNPKMKILRKKAMSLPLLPGVYIMKNADGEIIYIGKAKALKNRVSQYFGSQNRHPIKVRKMVENVDRFDYIVTGSEFEALVLECSLIKQHSPKYNILLKDDKGYSYIRISEGEYRKISAVFNKKDDGSEYIGPYLSSYSVRQSVDAANKIFKLPQCNKVFPRDFGKSRPCLNYYISQCCGLCTGKIKKSDYDEATDGTIAGGVFKESLKNAGIESVLPGALSQKSLMALIYRIKAGKEPDMAAFNRILQELVSGGAERIVLGCTEISILNLKEKCPCAVPYTDCMELLAEAAVAACGGQVAQKWRQMRKSIN